MTCANGEVKTLALECINSLPLLLSLQVQITPQDAMVTMDHRMDRVRLLVDQANKVVRAPKRG